MDFDDIRPYHDEEVPGVIADLLANPEAMGVVAAFAAPKPLRWVPPLARWATRLSLRRIVGDVRSIDDFQALVAYYFKRMVETTTDGFSFEGIDRLPAGRAWVFISNHRDISMDSGFLNYALYQSDWPTVRIAIGDNLLQRPFATDLMRLNKSFIVRRGLKGGKSAYAALAKTSAYIRQSIDERQPVWIAQREGRAKDGYDRTDPAVIKMLALAWRKEFASFAELVPFLSLVPVSISYEVDPCDQIKAHELAVRAATGTYQKAPDEDLQSIANGITGYKGRVHLTVGQPIDAGLEDADEVAAELDRQIVGGLRVFPTQQYAADSLAAGSADGMPLPEGASTGLRAFRERLRACPSAEREFLLLQYANLLRNRSDLGLPPA